MQSQSFGRKSQKSSNLFWNLCEHNAMHFKILFEGQHSGDVYWLKSFKSRKTCEYELVRRVNQIKVYCCIVDCLIDWWIGYNNTLIVPIVNAMVDTEQLYIARPA